MSALIVRLLNTLVSILEACFLRQEEKKNEKEESTNEEEELQAAFKLFEIDNPEQATRSSVKLKFRKLSLVHHPDRNGNTDESVSVMQRVNSSFDLINAELDRRDGIIHEDNDDDDNKDDEPPPEEYKTPQQASKAAKKRRKEERRRMAKERARMEMEMRREWEELKRQRDQIKKEKKKRIQKTRKMMNRHQLYTSNGRDRAHEEWAKAVNNMEQPQEQKHDAETPLQGEDGKDIDEGEASEETSKQEPKPAVTVHVLEVKPVNLIMECCCDESVIALRMSMADICIDIIQDQMNEFLDRVAARAFMSGGEVTTSDLQYGVSQYLLQSLDDDDNTLLHYAVYYESMDVINFTAYMCSSFDIATEVFLEENCHGEIPLDYAKSCVKDRAIPERMEQFTKAAKQDLESEQLLPSLTAAAKRIWGIVCNISLASTAETSMAYVIGRHLFGNGKIVSIAILVVVQTMEILEASHSSDCVALLFACHVAWYALYGTVSTMPSFLKGFPWELLFLAIPILVLVCGANSKPAGLDRWNWIGTVFFVPFALPLYTLTLLSGLIKIPDSAKKHNLEMLFCMTIFSVGTVAIKLLLQWVMS